MGLFSDIARGEGGVGGAIIFYTLVFITAVVGINVAWYMLGVLLNLAGIKLSAMPIGMLFVIIFWALICFAAFAGITSIYKTTTTGDRVWVLITVMIMVIGLYFLAGKVPGAFPKDFSAAILQMKIATQSILAP